MIEALAAGSLERSTNAVPSIGALVDFKVDLVEKCAPLSHSWELERIYLALPERGLLHPTASPSPPHRIAVEPM